MSHQQSDKHGPAIDDELKHDRRQAPVGTRHESRPLEDDAELDDEATPRPTEQHGVAAEHF